MASNIPDWNAMIASLKDIVADSSTPLPWRAKAMRIIEQLEASVHPRAFSKPPPRPEYSIMDLVDWMNDLVDHIDKFETDMFGHFNKLENNIVDRLNSDDNGAYGKVIRYICPLCGKKVDKLIQHHYSYFPAKIILICKSCNSRNNLEREHPTLCPSLEDARKFYGKEDLENTFEELEET